MFGVGARSAMRIVIALVLLVSATSCRGSRNSYEESQRLARERIEEGKAFLSQQRYYDAAQAFDDVLTLDEDGDDEVYDPSNSEARMGKVLAQLLQFASIIRVVNQFAGVGAEADENDFILSLVRDLLGDLTQRFETIAFDLQRLKTDPYVRLVLDDTPVYLTASDEPTLNLKGEWDRSEVFLMDAPVQALLGALKFGNSIDLRADFLGIYNRFVDLDIDFDGAPDVDLDGDPDEDTVAETVYGAVETVEFVMPKVQNLIAWMMNKNPNFLGLRPDGGRDMMIEAGDHFVNAIDSFQKALFFTSLDAHYDLDQRDDVIAWGEPVTYAGLWDVPTLIDRDLDTCAIRDTDEEDKAEYTFTINIVPPTEEDEVPQLVTSAKTSCLIEKLKDSLDNQGVRINLRNDILPVVLTALAEGFVEGISPDLIVDVVTSIFDDYVGDSLEFDFGPMFASPKGLRTFFPAWDSPEVEADEDLWLLVMESECRWSDPQDEYADEVSHYRDNSSAFYESRVVHRFFCREVEGMSRTITDTSNYCPADQDDGARELCDTDHFYPTEGTNAAPASNAAGAAGVGRIARDGVHGLIPYIAFQDPSFNGLLYVDVYNKASAENKLGDVDPDPAFSRATNATLNALLAFISSNFSDILGLIETL